MKPFAKTHTGLNACEFTSPQQNLLAAVVKLAVRDYRRGRPAARVNAYAYLYGPNFEADAALLGLDAQRFRALLGEEVA